MKARLSAREFVQWRHRVFDTAARNETDRSDWQAAVVAHQIYLIPYRIMGNKQKDKLLEPEDFLIKFAAKSKPEATKPLTDEEKEAKRKAAAEAAYAAFGPLIEMAINGVPSGESPPAPV